MPIALHDSRWKTLQTAYHQPCDELIGWLCASDNGELTDELPGDIINEIQHQGDTSTSMYAVAAHLLELATRYSGDISRELIIHAGLIHASATDSNAVFCPEEISDDFTESARRGLDLSATLLSQQMDTERFRNMLASIAGFAGHGRIGRFLEGVEFADDGVWCPHLDDPIPDTQSGG